jgi:hypothetical protein
MSRRATSSAKGALKRSTARGGPDPNVEEESDDCPETAGLCLSGGGIRSAAFCLGAMQALDATKAEGWSKPVPAKGTAPAVPAQRRTAFTYIDYLSSVSGGGYIGAATTARMRGTGKGFPFRSILGDVEPRDLRRIRDRSNYLFPPREWALLTNLSIYYAACSLTS